MLLRGSSYANPFKIKGAGGRHYKCHYYRNNIYCTIYTVIFTRYHVHAVLCTMCMMYYYNAINLLFNNKVKRNTANESAAINSNYISNAKDI